MNISNQLSKEKKKRNREKGEREKECIAMTRKGRERR